MPIELRELTIKIDVRDPVQTSDAAANGGGNTLPAADNDALLQRCVEEVMKVLQDQKER